MGWFRLFELFIIISLIVCSIKIELEKIKVEKERKELQEIVDRADAISNKAKIQYRKLQEIMLWFADEAGELEIYSLEDTKERYIKAEDLSKLIMELTDKLYKINRVFK